jgi:hypothetical protein
MSLIKKQDIVLTEILLAQTEGKKVTDKATGATIDGIESRFFVLSVPYTVEKGKVTLVKNISEESLRTRFGPEQYNEITEPKARTLTGNYIPEHVPGCFAVSSSEANTKVYEKNVHVDGKPRNAFEVTGLLYVQKPAKT